MNRCTFYVKMNRHKATDGEPDHIISLLWLAELIAEERGCYYELYGDRCAPSSLH